MPPASNEEQFKFLISCIRYSNNGKVDFGEVARECNIVSKGAAAKRYERMMKTHGISPNTSPKSSPSKASPHKEGTGRASKKRKADHFDEDAGEDDAEDYGGIIKQELAGDTETSPIIKQEPGLQQPQQFSEKGGNLLQFSVNAENEENSYMNLPFIKLPLDQSPQSKFSRTKLPLAKVQKTGMQAQVNASENEGTRGRQQSILID